MTGGTEDGRGGLGRDDSGRRGGSAGSVRHRRAATARIGWIAADRLAADRLVEGDFAGPGAENLRALLTIAAAQPEKPADAAGLEAVLAAFRRAAPNAQTIPRTDFARTVQTRNAQAPAAHARLAAAPARTARTSAAHDSAVHARTASRSRGSRLAAKGAVVLFLLSGSGVAAASAGILPASVQRIAHDYFGAVGIPAPSNSQDSGTSGASGSPGPTPSPGPTAASSATSATTASASQVALCRKVAANPQNWRSGIDSADQATLITAAGGAADVKQYCANLLAQTDGGDQGAATSPPEPNTPSQKGSPQPTATHGNGNSGGHSPSPHPSPTSRGATSH